MKKHERRLLKRLARARAEYQEIERSQRAAYAIPDAALPVIDFHELPDQIKEYVEANHAAPDLHVLDDFYIKRATQAVDTWEETGRPVHDQKLVALKAVQSQAHGLEAKLRDLAGTLGREWDVAEDTIKKADMRISRTQYALDSDAALPSTAPPAGGMLPMASSTVGRLFFWLLLAVAGALDIVAFTQVVSLVLRNVDDWVIWAGSVGFTGVALWLTHLAGQRMAHRKLVDREHPASSWAARTCISAWLTLGTVAFRVRATATADTTSFDTGITIGGEQIVLPFNPANNMQAALIFAALYVGSGVVALVGAYITYDPDARARRHAQRTRDRLISVKPEASQLYEKVKLLCQGIDVRVSDIERRFGASRDERITIVAGVPIASAHVALRTKYDL
jgi:hypothetical protein